jgi:pantoate--beta-alanine ligase
MKLLNLVRPNRAYFGLKDFQQYTLIKDMCETFFLATEIIGCPIVREADGLAMSSRNALLDVPARRLAGRLNTLLASAANDEQAVQSLQAADMSVAYVETVGSRRCAAVVIRSGDCAVRLIDNVAVSTSHLATELKGAVS